MDRKTFISMAPFAGVMTLVNCGTDESTENSESRDYYEIRAYLVENAEQVTGLDQFMAKAAIPALNRIGIEPVGVFQPTDTISPVYVVFRYRTLDTLVTATQQLLSDTVYLNDGADFLDRTNETPAFTRIESNLLIAFTDFPHLVNPAKGPNRVYQLRTYESSSVKRNQKKIEMFNTGEMPIFIKTGLNPVFMGEALVGTKMPQLTYMVGFNNMDEQVANWAKFQADPDWATLRTKPEYAGVVSRVNNTLLKPLDCSQI